MPQVLKEDIRERIRAAALEVFAARGYEGATMTAIAEKGEVATANLYRYYPGKSELLAAVVPEELAREFEELLERSVRSLAHLAERDPPPANRAADKAAGEALLRFWIDNRPAVVILLDRAAGTPYAAYGERFVERLVSLTIAEIRAANPGVRVGAPTKTVLTQIFENTRRTIAIILEANPGERAIREGIDAFRSYQIPGLRGLSRWIATSG